AEVASTQMQSITDAYWYLYAYPYECAEQRSSRMLATAAVYDILDAFAAPDRPTRQQIAAQTAKDVDQLATMQHRDGGWGYFEDTPSDPFVTQQVLTALVAHKAQRPPIIKKAIAFVTKQVDTGLAAVSKGDRVQAYDVSLTAASLTSLAAAHVDVTARA